MKMPTVPNERIVCPANAYRYLMQDTEGCRFLKCCYHCKRQKKCFRGAGCSKGIILDFPESCKTYPLTFAEAKRIFMTLRLFDPKIGYFYFANAVEKFMEEKKLAKKA